MPEAEEALELLETTVLPDDAQATPERPKRRRPYHRRNRDEAEAATSSSDATAGERPRRRYQRRVTSPEKVVERDAEALEAQLTVMFMMVGTPLSMAMPVTGTTMTLRAQQGAAAIIEAAKANPRIAAIVISMSTVGHYGPLMMFGATLLTAVAVDTGIAPPTSPPAQMMISDVLQRFAVQEPSVNGHAAQASGDANA